jgi:hypothetical protein
MADWTQHNRLSTNMQSMSMPASSAYSAVSDHSDTLAEGHYTFERRVSSLNMHLMTLQKNCNYLHYRQEWDCSMPSFHSCDARTMKLRRGYFSLLLLWTPKKVMHGFSFIVLSQFTIQFVGNTHSAFLDIICAAAEDVCVLDYLHTACLAFFSAVMYFDPDCHRGPPTDGQRPFCMRESKGG